MTDHPQDDSFTRDYLREVSVRITCRAIEPDGGFKIVEENAALAAWRDGQGPFWIDLENQDRGPIAAWLVKLDINQELIDQLSAADSLGKVLPLDELVFFEYPVPPLDNETKPATFACLTLARLVITMQDRPVFTVEQGSVTNRLRLREPTTSGLICALAVMQSARRSRGSGRYCGDRRSPLLVFPVAGLAGQMKVCDP